MAERWTVAKTYVLCNQYRDSKHVSLEDKEIDGKWWDMCHRTPRSAAMLYALSASPDAQLFKFFNPTMSMRKLEKAIVEGTDFSTIENAEEDEEEVATVQPEKKSNRGRKPAEAKQKSIFESDENLDVNQLLDLTEDEEIEV